MINKSLFSNCNCNWINILNDVFLTYNKNDNEDSTTNTTPVVASNSPEKIRTIVTTGTTTAKGTVGHAQLKIGDYVKKLLNLISY